MTIKWLLMASHVPAGGGLGGMVRYTVEVARGLAAHPDIQLSVLADPSAATFWADIVSRDRVHSLPNVPTPIQSALERQGRGSRAFNEPFDVIHGTKHILPKHHRARTTALTVHDFLPLDRPGDFGVLKRALLPGPYLASASEADALVCVSAATKDRLLSYQPAVADRAHVVPLANESAGLADANSEPVAELIGQDFALVVGDPSPRKNLEFLVDLWNEVTSQHGSAKLVSVGPPAWQGGEGLANEPEHPGIVQLGRINDDALRWCYENARVVLCPSLLEGFGLPSVEGLRFGTPVITSADPAMCEATKADATHISTLDRQRWVAAIVAAFRSPTRVPEPSVRTWQEVANETVEAVTNSMRVSPNAS
jgi:glycosyltransferase involved in cell wall biosynthesis